MINIAPMQLADYDEAIALWKATEGITIDASDSREEIEEYLLRNPGLSFVARHNGTLVGAVLGGHDGRRGYLHHLAVAPPYRGKGTGRRLAENVLAGLKQIGILKCHLFVHADNFKAIKFWKYVGWSRRDDIVMFTKSTGYRPK
jgi:ribosomal protein S18 acetylase RimI-like enzyme